MKSRRKAASTANEIASIEELMGDLEKRLRRLNGATKREISGGSADMGEFINEALAEIMNGVREGASSVSQSVAGKATNLGSGTFKKIAEEVEQRPLAMLAIATGIGFLVGMSRR